MSSLKTDTFSHHLDFIKKDLIRIISLVSIPLLSNIIHPLDLFRPTHVLWLLIPPLIIFTASLIIQLCLSLKPDYKPNFNASLIFTFHLIFLNAFAEEIFFRQFLQTIFTALINNHFISIIITSALFGLYHIPLFKWTFRQAFIAFLGSLFFGLVFHYSNSFLAVWLTHAAADLGLVHESIIGYFVWTRVRNKEII